MMRTLLLLFVSFLFIPAAPAQPAALGKISASVDYATALPGANASVQLQLTVAPHHHAQSNKPIGEGMIACVVTPTPAAGVKWLEVVYPPGKNITDPLLGPLNVYEGTVTFQIPLSADPASLKGPVELKGSIVYQICDEKGSCFPPEEPAFTVTLDPTKLKAPAPATQAAGSTQTPAQTPSQASTPKADGPSISLFGSTITLSGLGVVIPVAMLVGLIFNVMPCVLPVLPLKALGFYEASQHNRAKTVSFGISFSLGLILIFTVLAMFAITSRSLLGYEFQFGAWFSIGWVVWGMAIVLVVLGIGMLDVFAVTLPNSIYGLSFRHDTLGGNFMWGVLTAVLSTPCTAPMFASLMIWAVAQPIPVAMIGMVSVGVGMALPYIILSAFPELARRFPRTGPVSELVKQSMAFLLFATAAWLIGLRLVDDPNQYWLVVGVAGWASLFILIRSAQIFKTAGGVLASSAIVVLIFGGSVILALEMTGKLDDPVAANSPAATSNSIPGAEQHGIWLKYTDDAFEQARRSNHPVLVKFTASWCLNCKYIERTVFTDSRAIEELQKKNVILLKADLSKENAPGLKLLNQLGQSGIPFTVIYPPGQDKPITLASIYTTNGLIEALRQVQ